LLFESDDRPDDGDVCANCYETRLIHSYNTRPDCNPIGDGPIWYGVELEMMPANLLTNSLRWMKSSQYSERFIMKTDGSVGGGAEMCTSPMSLDEHRKFWTAMFEAGINKKWRAWEYAACGMHVHMTKEMLDVVGMSKLVAAMNAQENSARLDQLAGRQQNTYCVRGQCSFTVPSDSHYSVVSSSRKYPTIEIRAFKASMNLKRIITCVEFCAVMVEWIMQRGVGLLKSRSFKNIEKFAVENRDRYPAYAGFVLWGPRFFVDKSVPINAAQNMEPEQALSAYASVGESDVEK